MSAPATIETDWLGDATAPPAPNPGGRPAKGHVGRQRKVHCERCGFIAYASRRALQRSGLPVCGCGEPMALANLRDRYAIEPDAVESELHGYGRAAYVAGMREIGETPERESGGRYGHGGAGQHRCEWEGGYCTKYSGGRYCPEHSNAGRAAATARKGAWR